MFQNPKIVLSPTYAYLQQEIRKIPAGDYRILETYCDRRNMVRKIELAGGRIFVLKQYKRPTRLNPVSYTHLDVYKRQLSGTSIDESDTRREYRFDRTTGRLIGLKIEQTDGKTPVTIAELQRIVYDIPLSDTLFRAYDGIEWIDLTKPVGGVHFAAIAPEEAARTLFAAMQTWDTEILAEGLVFYPLDLMKERYAGCRLLERCV